MYIKKYLKTIKPGERVIDLGSGNDPYLKADVCVDYYIDENLEREGLSIVKPDNGNLVVWDLNVYPLPFKDKEFDFVICSHIVEHLDDPITFCNEIQRIGKRGYIETPNKLYEQIFGWGFHKWYVSIYGNNLLFEKIVKKSPFTDLGRKLYGHNKLFTKLHDEQIEFLLTSFYWEDSFACDEVEASYDKKNWKYISLSELDQKPFIIKHKYPFWLKKISKIIKRNKHD